MNIINDFLLKNKWMDKTLLIFIGKAFAAILFFFIIWLIIKKILDVVEKKLNKSDGKWINLQTMQIGRKFIYYLFLLISFLSLSSLLHVEFLSKIVFAVFIILLAQPLQEFTLFVIQYVQKNIANDTKTKIDDIIFDLLNRFLGIIIYVAAIFISLDLLGINIMPFVAGAGIIGIAIGFAAKDTLSNVIAGILLIIDRPFEIGDRIEVWSSPAGTSTWGDVIEIGLRATKIKTTDNILIIVPNNEIMKRDILNYTMTSSMIRVRINIGVAYDSDISKVKKVILKVADSCTWVSKKPFPVVVVRNFGESSVDLQLRLWIENARKRMNTISYITDKVKYAFDEEDIEIPYPKRDIVIHNKI